MGRERYSPAQQAAYKAYLNSPAWRTRKTARIRKAGNQCEFVITCYTGSAAIQRRCPRHRYLTVHHNTYQRLGAEQDTDLDVLCWAHHMLEHLLQKRCRRCGNPCLVHDAAGEAWMNATLAQLRIDLDSGPVKWMGLPTKEQLADTIPDVCPHCSPHLGGKP